MTLTLQLVDTHAHLHCSHFDQDREWVMEQATQAGVTRIVEVGYDVGSSRAACSLAEQHKGVYAVVGVQPNHAHEAAPNWLEQIHTLAEHPSVVAIGEIGLDYYRDFSPRNLQAQVFIDQLRLAHERNLPVVIHTREAGEDTLQILRTHAQGQRGIMHSFSGNWEFAKACLDIGFLLSFSGPVTFAKAKDLHTVARRVPLDSLLIETDSPYLSPHPFRGKRNEPARVRLVAEHIAELRGISLEEVAEAVWENAKRIFKW